MKEALSTSPITLVVGGLRGATCSEWQSGVGSSSWTKKSGFASRFGAGRLADPVSCSVVGGSFLDSLTTTGDKEVAPSRSSSFQQPNRPKAEPPNTATVLHFATDQEAVATLEAALVGTPPDYALLPDPNKMALRLCIPGWGPLYRHTRFRSRHDVLATLRLLVVSAIKQGAVVVSSPSFVTFLSTSTAAG